MNENYSSNRASFIVGYCSPSNRFFFWTGGNCRRFSWSVILFLLAGCSANLTELNQAQTLLDLKVALQHITATDLDAATARAVAAEDLIGAMCYPILKQYVAFVSPGDGTAGIFDSFEKKRLLGIKVHDGIPEELRIACAPLVIDQRDMIAKLAAIARP